MNRRFVLVLVAGFLGICVVSGSAQAQVTGRTPASDTVFRRAVNMVNDGEGEAGRALLDSMVNAARPGSLELAEALYWRAAIAASAAEAEQDYRRVILDHPLSPRVPDALLRLAQLELARGDRENAIRRLQRLDLEYPAVPNRARTSYWLARAYLDQNDIARGCAAVGEARLRATPKDVELRNQIDFLALRCPIAPSTSVVTAPGTTPAGSAAGPTPAEPTAPAPAAAGPEPRARDTQPSVPVEAATRPPASPPPATPTTGSTAAPSGAWSVQVAAFTNRSQANALAERLRTRGYQARVDGSAAPFRVRIGRYAGRSAAAQALQQMKARGIDGFLVQADPR